jgi:hypothetical protein
VIITQSQIFNKNSVQILYPFLSVNKLTIINSLTDDVSSKTTRGINGSGH